MRITDKVIAETRVFIEEVEEVTSMGAIRRGSQMAGLVGQWTLRGTGYWALEERSASRFVGSAGLYNPVRVDWPGVEVGWTLDPSSWGNGYATEAGIAARDHGFGELGRMRRRQRDHRRRAIGTADLSRTISGCRMRIENLAGAMVRLTDDLEDRLVIDTVTGEQLTQLRQRGIRQCCRFPREVLEQLTDRAQSGARVDLDAVTAEYPELANDLRQLWGAVMVADAVANYESTSDSNEPAADRPVDLPKRIAGYELLDELGRGGMGVVFRAHQLSLDRTVAVKLILRGQLASATEQARFRAEAESAAQLDHPGIVPIYEVGDQDGQLFFSMRYVEGETLGDRLARGASWDSEHLVW